MARCSLVTGAYVAYYGYYELRLFHADGSPADPVIEAAGHGAAHPSRLGGRGRPRLVLAVALVVLVAGGLALTRRVRQR